MGHTPVRFDLHLKGASQRVVNFVRPKPIELAPREELERLLLVDHLLDPTEDGSRAALSLADVDQAWAFWTTGAQETLLALSCPDIAPNTLPLGAALPLAPPHLPRGKGTDRLLRDVRLCPKQRRDTGGPLTCPLGASEWPRAPSKKSSAGWNSRRTVLSMVYRLWRVCPWRTPSRGRSRGPTQRPLASARPRAPWMGQRRHRSSWNCVASGGGPWRR